MKESVYQALLIEKIQTLIPGCFIRKTVPPPQGIPDLEIIYNRAWAMLEVKNSINEPYRPNQEYYLDLFSTMGFARMICPENEEEVLTALCAHFKATGTTNRI